MTLKKTFIHTYGIQDLKLINAKKILKSLKDDIITNGNNCKKLEKFICKLTNSRYSVVCNNGTSALMMSLLSINYKKLVVIIPNINFVASANILSLINAKIVLCDVNKETGMIERDNLVKTVEECKKKGVKPNVLIPIHYAGDVLDIKKISGICKKNKIKIIEDGCHSFGSKKKFSKDTFVVGQSKYSDMTTFSFHPVKNITTIEGGAITTNSKKIYEKLILLRNHSLKKTFKSDPYKMIWPTLNFRMGEFNALIGIEQLRKLKIFKKKRNELVKYYLKKFKNLNNILLPLNYYNKDIFWHLFVIKLNKKLYKKKKNLMNFLSKFNIASQIHYKPIYRHDIYKKKIVINQKKFSDHFYKSQLTLPLHTRMSKGDIDYIHSKIKYFFSKA